MNRILVVDDEESMRQLLEIALGKDGYRVTAAESGGAAIQLLEENAYDLVISDIKMPDMSGVEVLRHVKETDPSIPVIMVTAYASAETAVEALRLGAYDYLTKPFKVEELKTNISNALEKERLKEEVDNLKRELKHKHGLDSMLGRSPVMLELFEHLKSVAATMSTVLITGESGTGKELAARAIHVNSPRANEPFVSINCGAVPETLLESELFGHLKGSFTGATTNHKGLFEVAHRGTIFLDEIGEMSPTMQVKLLRVLQEKRIRRIGSTEEIEVDVRILAATNKDLEAGVRDKSFREDLYYRLNVIPIHLPPLRERMSDVPLLAEHSLSKAAAAMGKTVNKISEEALELLCAYDWPGNVRELENVLERAVALERTSIIMPERLPEKIRHPGGGRGPADAAPVSSVFPEEGLDFGEKVASLEKELLSSAMERASGVQTKAAKLLKMNLRSFRYLLSKYNLR
ncbi:MAG TPA: sigma-54 dependent transcriptional regulator [Vicinamibacteria bacterium]|nr:sigma-54 dependent transcriptional regulator [Vicinamibacteria bacterium]